jgi:FixJ family two-component response regulator
VRESLELLILSAGWQPETFASAEDFLGRSRIDGPSCVVLDVPNLNGLDLQKRIVDRRTCRSSSSQGMATCQPRCRR